MLENKKDRRRMLLIEGAEICLMFGFIYARLYATGFFSGGGFKVETDLRFKANMHHHFGISHLSCVSSLRVRDLVNVHLCNVVEYWLLMQAENCC